MQTCQANWGRWWPQQEQPSWRGGVGTKALLGSDVEIYIYHTIKCRPLEWRVAQLQALLRCYDENEDLFAEALAKDLRKPRQEAVMFEVKISNHRFKELCLG